MSDKDTKVRSLISQYIVSAGAADGETAAGSLAQSIQAGELTLLEFIRYLGPHLTDDTDRLRSSAVACLVDTVVRSPVKRADLAVLADFFISKLSDEPCTLEALRGLDCLVNKPGFDFKQISGILEALKGYDPKKHLSKVRYWGFELLNSVLAKFSDQLVVALNDGFIEAYLHVSANEKDPKNLMLSFGLNKRILQQFQVETKAGELFDAAFCYFPISFKPPANDPYKITPDQLKQALRSVISANSVLAKDSFPSLIEKLSSTAPSVKLDTLQTIDECVRLYDEATMEEYWLSLWNSLKFEILHAEIASVDSMDDLVKYYTNAENEEEKVIPLVLDVFASLGAKFSGQDAGLRDYISVVVNELGKSLVAPESKQAKQSAIILSAIASANVHSFNLVMGEALPFVLKALDEGLTIFKQRSIITNVSFLLDAYSKLFQSDNAIDPDTNALFGFKSDIVMLLTRSLVSSSKVEVTLRCLAIKTIGKIINLRSLLNVEEGKLLVQSLTETLLEDDNSNTFGAAVAGLREVAKIRPAIIVEVTLPELLKLLPDDVTLYEASSNKCIGDKQKVLRVISDICENKEILDVIMVRFLSKLAVLLKTPDSTADVRAVLATLEAVLKKSAGFSGMSTNDYLRKFVPQFLSLVLDSPAYHDRLSLESSGSVLKTIIVGADLSLHQKVLNDFMNLFVLGGEHSLLAKPLSAPAKLFSAQSAAPLLSKVLSAVDKTSAFPVEPTEFFDQIVTALESETDVFVRQSFLQILSLLVNKWLSDAEFLDSKRSQFREAIGKGDLASRAANLELLVWTTKALILKNAPITETLTYLVSLLSDPELSGIAPKAFEVLVADVEAFEPFKKEAATKTPFAKKTVFNISVVPLYKQKFFSFLIPALIEGFNGSSDKRNYLVTLSLVAKYAERAIIVPHLEAITPLLMQSLDIENDEIRSSSLQILEIAISEYPVLIKQQLQTLIPRLLDLVQAKTSSDVKINALKCLLGLAINENIGFVALMPYKTGIIRNLLPVLDDKKRAVRKMASDCRQQYYELAQASE